MHLDKHIFIVPGGWGSSGWVLWLLGILSKTVTSSTTSIHIKHGDIDKGFVAVLTLEKSWTFCLRTARRSVTHHSTRASSTRITCSIMHDILHLSHPPATGQGCLLMSSRLFQPEEPSECPRHICEGANMHTLQSILEHQVNYPPLFSLSWPEGKPLWKTRPQKRRFTLK